MEKNQTCPCCGQTENPETIDIRYFRVKFKAIHAIERQLELLNNEQSCSLDDVDRVCKIVDAFVQLTRAD